MIQNNFLMIKDVAKEYMVTPKTVREWIKAGKLNAILTPGGHRRIRKSEFDNFKRENQKEIVSSPK